MVKIILALMVGLLLLSLPVVGQDSLSDPTAPLGYKTKAERSTVFTLQSIFKSTTGSKAIVNGKLLAVGDSVSGAKLLTINDASVVMATGNGVQKLELHRQIKKSSASQ